MSIVSFLGRDWELWQRRPHMEGLSRFSDILCVEPPLTIDTFFRKPWTFWQWLIGRKGLRQLSDSLWLCKPVALVPYYLSFRFSFLRGMNRIIMKASLGRILRKLDFEDYVVMLNHPAQCYLVGMFGRRPLCYDVYDAYAEAATLSPSERRRMVEEERRMLLQADVVFATARSLADDKRRHNANTYFVPNAADTAMFAASLSEETQVPPDLRDIAPPRIGFIGHIDDSRADIDLFNLLAERHPEWRIVIIGRLEVSSGLRRSPAFRKWQSLPNVHYLGFKEYRTLPAYMKGLDVCLIPYKVNAYTKGVFVNKLFQYLAGGKAVVSTDIPEMRPYADVIAIAKDHPEFERLVEEALRDKSPEKIALRISMARENSVERRAKEKIDILESFLQGNPQRAAHE